MLSNLGNILLFGSILITLSIIYFAYQNIKEKILIEWKTGLTTREIILLHMQG